MFRTNPYRFFEIWRRGVDGSIFLAIVSLFCFSALLVTTSGPAVSYRIGLEEYYFAKRQLAYLVLSACLIFIFSLLDRIYLKRIALAGFFFSLLLLLLTKFYGYEVKGALRWINIFGFSMQASEFAKPFFAATVGWILSLKFEGDFPSFWISLALYSALAFFLLTQPDFGMFVMVTAVFCAQLFAAGMPVFWIAFSLVCASFCAVGAYFFLPHVAKRINNFFDPASGENYQVEKSLNAFAGGGFYGKGPGEGSVKQTLPDSHTDFIFAVAGEELGALVSCAIALIFAFIVIKSIIKLFGEKDAFARLAGVGIVSQFGLQSVINMGVSLNLLPTKGMTLPFISYGGCSTLTMGISMGMLLAFIRENNYSSKYTIGEVEI